MRYEVADTDTDEERSWTVRDRRYDWVTWSNLTEVEADRLAATMNGEETDRELVLLSSISRHIDAANSGDIGAQRRVDMNVHALIRWHEWTKDAVMDWLTVVSGMQA